VSISPPAGGSSLSDPGWRPEEPSARPKLWTIIILVVVVALAGATGYLFTQLKATRGDLAAASQKIQAHEEQIAKLEGSVTRTYQQAEQNISALRGEVTSTRGQVQATTGSLKKELLSQSQQTQEVAERLSAEQKAAAARVGTEIEQIRTAASGTESKVGALSGDVSGVRTELGSTREELKRTIAELKSVRGDLGVQSGLIATNGSELNALKRLGERNYFEFDLKKTKTPQRVGSVSMKLKSTDTKRNRYTVELIADDRLTEKRDRTVNEPVQFYVAKAKIPYEIVVNTIDRDRIVGYMATPKDQGR